MPWQAYNFALLPIVGAILIELPVTRARVALWIALALIAVFLTLARVSPVDLRQVLPFLTGAAVGGLSLAMLFHFRPSAGPMLRILVAVGAAAALHWTYLAYALETR